MSRTNSRLALVSSLFPPDLPDCNLDMVLDLLSSIGAAIKTGGGGVGIVIVEAAVSSSGIVGHEVKVLAASEDGVPEAPDNIPEHHSTYCMHDKFFDNFSQCLLIEWYAYLYTGTHLLANLSWIVFDFGCSTLSLVLPGLMGNWQNWLNSRARWWSIPN